MSEIIHLTKKDLNLVFDRCPFCGSYDIELCNTHTPSYWVECEGCGAQIHGPHSEYEDDARGHIDSANSAANAWNERFSSQ